MELNGTEVRFYYKHWNQKIMAKGDIIGVRGPVVVSCTARCGVNHARGVAICSPLDKPKIEDGKEHARRYALEALKYGAEKRINDKRAMGVLILTDCPWVYRGEKNPDLAGYEIKALWGSYRKYQEGYRVPRPGQVTGVWLDELPVGDKWHERYISHIKDHASRAGKTHATAQEFIDRL